MSTRELLPPHADNVLRDTRGGSQGEYDLPVSVSSGGAVIFLSVKSGQGRLHYVSGQNSGAAGFCQIFDLASGVAPASGAVPFVTFAIIASQGFSINWGTFGMICKAGIVVATSSTAFTYTATAAVASFTVVYS